jgi:transcriptional regulator with XRE-family HTH domain
VSVRTVRREATGSGLPKKNGTRRKIVKMKCNQSYEIPGLISLRESVRARREELRMSQPQLARAAKLGTAEFLSMLEHGLRRISLSRVVDLAQALRIEPKSMLRLAIYERCPREAVLLFGRALQTYLPREAESGAGSQPDQGPSNPHQSAAAGR